MRCLKDLGGENGCLPLLGGFKESCGFIAVLPYFEHDDFKWYLPRLTTGLLRAYLYGLFRSLKHVHHHGIIHRDVKPRNYLFSLSKRKGLLIDFGYSIENIALLCLVYTGISVALLLIFQKTYKPVFQNRA